MKASVASQEVKSVNQFPAVSLVGKVAVVLGGTGGVGEGIVKALLTQGATVVVPTRSASKGEQLKEYVGTELAERLVVRMGTVQDEQSALELGQYLHDTYDHIDMAVASIGGWSQGYPLYSYPVQEWYRILADNLTPHFLAIKTLVPLLNPKTGAYYHINGFSAEEGYANAGPVAMTAAAQKSLMVTLSQEVKRTGIHVNELILGPMKTRARLRYGHGQPEWYTPEEVGQYIAHLQGLETQVSLVHYLLSKEVNATA